MPMTGNGEMPRERNGLLSVCRWLTLVVNIFLPFDGSQGRRQLRGFGLGVTLAIFMQRTWRLAWSKSSVAVRRREEKRG